MLANRTRVLLFLAACAAAAGPAAARQMAGKLEGAVEPWIAIEEAKLLPGDPEHTQYFAQAVAVSGDTAVVGAAGSEPGGAAYVYVRSGSGWSQQQKLVPSEGALSFGSDVAISGERIAVGDRGQAVYVFERLGSHWSEKGKIPPPEPLLNDAFGDCVAVSGDTILVGDERYSGGGGLTLMGAAFVFVKAGDAWIQEAKLVLPDPEASDLFGHSVALSGDTALVGALWDDLANGSNDSEGTATVFVRNAGIWSEQQILKPPGAQDNDEFGYSVAIEGDIALVGQPQHDGPGMDTGAAHVFVRSGASWTKQQVLQPSDPKAYDHFAESVALSGTTALVSAHLDDHVNGSSNNEGSGYVFVTDGASWSEVAKLTASDAEPHDSFGYDVSLSGDTAVIGADDNGVAGAAYVDRLHPPAVVYCTAGTSASGCQALLSASGVPSATAPSGFTLSAATVEGQKDGLFFFGTSGQQANPWGNGTSYQCVVPPVVRAGTLSGSGTPGACDGSFAQDLNALWCPSCPKPAKNPGAGAVVQAQLWYRDPLSTSNQTTSLSDAVEFSVGF
jgi:hypothetical protein